jgi:ankyrin repeat protein
VLSPTWLSNLLIPFQPYKLPEDLSEMEWIHTTSLLADYFEKNHGSIPRQLLRQIFLVADCMTPSDWKFPSSMQKMSSLFWLGAGIPGNRKELPSDFPSNVQAMLLCLWPASRITEPQFKQEFPRLYRLLDSYQIYHRQTIFRLAGRSFMSPYEVDYEDTKVSFSTYQRSKFGSSPFYRAVLVKDLPTLETLLAAADDAGELVNTVVTPWNTTPLHLACRIGAWQVASILLEHGADINGIEKHEHFRMTPLAYAVMNKHTETVRVLLSWSCSMRKAGYCTFCRNTSTCRADPWFTNPAMRSGGLFVHYLGTMETFHIYEMLLERDSGLTHAREPRGKTPLHRAAEFLKLDVAKMLIERGADVNARDDHGITPLHKAYAALGGFTATASISPEAAESIKYRIGHSKRKAYEMIEYLCSKGADEVISDDAGRYPGDYQYTFFLDDYTARGWRYWVYYGVRVPISWAFKPLGWFIRAALLPGKDH